MPPNARPSGRPKGRPPRSSADIEAIRDRIVSIASDLFGQHGVEAISIRRLAGAVGCTPMTLYKYFPAKIDILRAIWMQMFEALFDHLDALAAAERDPVRRLRIVAAAYVDYWIRHPERYFIVFMASGVTQADVGAFLADDRVLARFTVLTDALAAALGGGAGADTLKRKADCLIAVLHGVAHNQITISSYQWTVPDHIIDEAVDGLLRH